MKKRKVVGVILGVFVLMVVWISGCATPPPPPTTTPTPPEPLLPGQFDGYITVAVDSIAVPNAASKGKTYLITSAMQNVGDEDLQFQEFARYIENVLSQRGYIRVRQQETADLLIRLAYGIGDPKTTTETFVIGSQPEYRYWDWWHDRWVIEPAKTETRQRTTTTYMRHLILEAYDLKDPKRQQLWKTTVKSEGRGSDLRIVLPFMITAAVPYFWENTTGQKVITISGRDKRVLDIRK